jgi:hypothetical protein
MRNPIANMTRWKIISNEEFNSLEMNAKIDLLCNFMSKFAMRSKHDHVSKIEDDVLEFQNPNL